MKHILVTGGAGFIGSHLCDELLQHGYRVRVLDNLTDQVHGPDRARPVYLSPDVELLVGDIRDPAAVRRALADVDAVFHFVATVGVGQSMYEIVRFTDVNALGTAMLLEALARRPVEKLVVASSMSISGEGLYRDAAGQVYEETQRSLDQLKASDWEMRNLDGERLTPVPTPESKKPTLVSIYALNKYDQERMCLMIGQAYGIQTAALRFFNVYGPNQSLSNPYTGVLAIFASRLINGNRPSIFEDGNQVRDFVSVHDVVRGCRLALEVEHAAGGVFNIGSGRGYRVREIAERLAKVLGKYELQPEISGRYRVGDIRHCFADISLARGVLGYEPQVELEDGMLELAGWLEGQVAHDRFGEASAELAARGLVV
jgi:dTDP-L-rhamnose 4-epimerase